MDSRIRHSLQQINAKTSQLLGMGVISLAFCLTLLLLVGWLCQEVWEKEAFGFDRAILLSIHQWANPWLDQLMLSVTRLGDPIWVVGVVAGTLAWLGWQRRYRQAVMFIMACLGAFVLNVGMKVFFAKSRPELWPRLIPETSFSFPSGHALGSMVLYGALAYLLVQRLPQQAVWIYAFAGGVIGAIGISRLYLGVHWPTDILAGYGVGFLWLISCITAYSRLRFRSK